VLMAATSCAIIAFQGPKYNIANSGLHTICHHVSDSSVPDETTERAAAVGVKRLEPHACSVRMASRVCLGSIPRLPWWNSSTTAPHLRWRCQVVDDLVFGSLNVELQHVYPRMPQHFHDRSKPVDRTLIESPEAIGFRLTEYDPSLPLSGGRTRLRRREPPSRTGRK